MIIISLHDPSNFPIINDGNSGRINYIINNLSYHNSQLYPLICISHAEVVLRELSMNRRRKNKMMADMSPTWGVGLIITNVPHTLSCVNDYQSAANPYESLSFPTLRSYFLFFPNARSLIFFPRSVSTHSPSRIDPLDFFFCDTSCCPLLRDEIVLLIAL